MAKTVRYYIDVDASGAVKGSGLAEDALQKVDKQAGNTGVAAVAMGNIFADVASQMVSRLADLPGKIFEIGTNVEETSSKYNTVFGPSVDYVNQFLDEFAIKAGLSNQQAQELTSRAGAIGQGFGYTQEESAKLSTEIAGLAGDLTSFNNVPIEQSSNAIISALSGEREALKTLGIVVNENDVQRQALIETGKDSVDQLSQQEKAQATLTLIQERAGVAVGDLERTQDSAANTARRVEAQLANIGEELSTEFLPLLADGLSFLEEILNSEQFDAFMEGTRAVIQNIIIGIDFLKENTDAGIEAIWTTWEWLKDNIATLFINLVTVAKNYVLSLPQIFWNGIEAIFKIFQSLEDYSTQTLKNILSGFVELGKAIFSALTDPLNAKSEIEQAFSNLLEIGKAQVDNFKDLGKDLGETLYENFQDNAQLLADGLIEYDDKAFTGVEFTTWSDAAKQRLQEGLKTEAPKIDMPAIGSPGTVEPIIMPAPEFETIDVGEIDFSGMEPNWSEILFIPDGTIGTLNKNLAKIDLIPDATIAHLQEQLGVVQNLYVNAQSDAERARLAEVESGIELQLEARKTGLTEEQLLWEEHVVMVSEKVQEVAGYITEGLQIVGQFQQQQTDRELSRIENEKKQALAKIDAELKKENLSEKERERLLKQRGQTEEKFEEKVASLKRQAFEKQKRAKTFMAIVDTASAVVEALPNIPLAVIAGIMGAAQVAIIQGQPNPYLEGGMVMDRIPEGKTTPGMKMISINENGRPEYVINAESTSMFEPWLDLMNYHPAEAAEILANMDVNPEPFISGGLVGESLYDIKAPSSSPMQQVVVDVPGFEQANTEAISDAVKEGFESLSVELRADIDDFIIAFEERQAERTRLGN